MPLDASKIGQVVAEQMEALEARFGLLRMAETMALSGVRGEPAEGK